MIALLAIASALPVDEALQAVEHHTSPDGPARLRPDTLRGRLETLTADCVPTWGSGGEYSLGQWSGSLGGLPASGRFGGSVSGSDHGTTPVPVHLGSLGRGEARARYAGADLRIVYTRTTGSAGIWLALGGCDEVVVMGYGQSNVMQRGSGYGGEPTGPGTDWPGQWYRARSATLEPELLNSVGLEGVLLRDEGVTYIRSGRSGASLDDWGRADGLLDQTLSGLDEIDQCPDVAVWLQGEADARSNKPPPDHYGDTWGAEIGDRLSLQCPGVLHVFAELGTSGSRYSQAYVASINTQMRELAEQRDDLIVMPTDDLVRSDGVHYRWSTPLGQPALGERVHELLRRGPLP